jgi:hypothetical protein
MNVLVALMITKTDEQDAQISLIKQRIEEISGTTDVITRFFLGFFCRKQKNSQYRPPKVCITSTENKDGKCHFWHLLKDGLDNTNFLGFKPHSHYWLVKEHNPPACENLASREFRMGKRLIELTIAMLKEKEIAKSELMKNVGKFQDETEKELKAMLDNEEGESLLDNNKSCSEARLNKIDLRLEKLESNFKELFAKLDKFIK